MIARRRVGASDHRSAEGPMWARPNDNTPPVRVYKMALSIPQPRAATDVFPFLPFPSFLLHSTPLSPPLHQLQSMATMDIESRATSLADQAIQLVERGQIEVRLGRSRKASRPRR